MAVDINLNNIQPAMACKKIGYWTPPGNGTTLPGVFGIAAFTTTGFSAGTIAVAATNLATRARRLRYATSPVAGQVGHFRQPAFQWTVGNSGTQQGGFYYVIRFSIADAAPVAGARFYMGMSRNGVPTNVEPSTITDGFGVGHGAADTNLKIFYGGSAAQTPIDLGANFPITGNNSDLYELVLSSERNSGNVYYKVTRLNTGNEAEGTITNSGATVLPTNTSLISPWGFRTNNATAAAVTLDIVQAYIESDY